MEPDAGEPRTYEHDIRQAFPQIDTKSFAVGLAVGIVVLFLASPFLIRSKPWKQYDKVARFVEFKVRGGKASG